MCTYAFLCVDTATDRPRTAASSVCTCKYARHMKWRRCFINGSGTHALRHMQHMYTHTCNSSATAASAPGQSAPRSRPFAAFAKLPTDVYTDERIYESAIAAHVLIARSGDVHMRAASLLVRATLLLSCASFCSVCVSVRNFKYLCCAQR
jgi:hypothetical protein